jgi:hypothetical protein
VSPDIMNGRTRDRSNGTATDSDEINRTGVYPPPVYACVSRIDMRAVTCHMDPGRSSTRSSANPGATIS